MTTTNPIYSVNSNESITPTVANYNSVRSLLFLRELLIDSLSNVIISSDVANKKLVLDSTNSYQNIQMMIDYKNKLVPQIEKAVNPVFQKYIDGATNAHINNINGIINQISINVAENMTITPELGTLHANLVTTVETALSK